MRTTSGAKMDTKSVIHQHPFLLSTKTIHRSNDPRSPMLRWLRRPVDKLNPKLYQLEQLEQFLITVTPTQKLFYTTIFIP